MARLLNKVEVMGSLSRFNALMTARREAPGVVLGKPSKDIVFVGDLHGDDKVLDLIKKEFFKHAILVFLGDYVDRSPKDCPSGSIFTFLGIVEMKLEAPDEVFMLRGNHESYSYVEFSPHELPLELRHAFGAGGEEVLEMFELCFAALPLFLLCENGVFAVHGGIYPAVGSRSELLALKPGDEAALKYLTWGDPSVTKTFRGDLTKEVNFTHEQCLGFLDAIGAHVMLRGHDYSTLGYALYDDRLLTVFTSRRYQDKGHRGILVAKAPTGKDIKSVFELEVLELKGEAWVPYSLGSFDSLDADI